MKLQFNNSHKRKEEIGAELFAHIERMVLLQMIDVAWKENLYELDQSPSHSILPQIFLIFKII